MKWDSIKTIAIFGLSDNPERDSNKVAKYFLENGYNIIPINPNCTEIFGIKCYSSIEDIPNELSNEIDMVDIFRRSEFVLPIVEFIVNNKNKFKNLKVIWMQEGVSDTRAFDLASENGFEVIMNSCAKKEHFKLEFKL